MIQYQLIIKYRKVFKMSKLNKEQIKELSIAQQKLNETRQLFEDFKLTYIEDLDHDLYDVLQDKIEDLETIENDIDKEFKLN
tara:strand:+ start:184 stop:429 length:246 start_codon:yes stop_codon:yes gene_type:complete